MQGIVDSGWAAWLPEELTAALVALGGGSAARRELRQRLAAGPDDAARERWERFRLVAPSRLDLPYDADGLTADECYAVLAGLGLVAGSPPLAVASPEPVELVLTLDHDDVRELERVRSAREAGGAATPVDALPSLDERFGGREVGRNDPCPCGSGRKFKRCHGA